MATGQKLAEMIHENGNRMSTGFLGTRPLLPVLTRVGQHDLAMFLFQSREFPSWGYEVEQGATTIWERWDSLHEGRWFRTPQCRHEFVLHIIRLEPSASGCSTRWPAFAHTGPGYQKIIIYPRPAAPGSNAEREVIDWVKASYDSVRGRIVSNWRIDGDRFVLDVEIPANTTAMVVIPAVDASQIRESGKPVPEPDGMVKFVRMVGNRALLNVPSGKYQFESAGAIKPADKAYKTSPPPDNSTNPEEIDLEGAEVVASWDFSQEADVAQWPKRNNLKVEQRDGKTFLVSTGNDPQLETQLAEPAAGKLVIALTARPVKGATVEFFWAGENRGFSAGNSNARPLNSSSETHHYLFRLGGDIPIRKLRMDPFQNDGEMQIDSITLYRLAD